MNPTILNKCIDELKKAEPDLSYIRGMLETLVELSANQIQHVPFRPSTTAINTLENTVADENSPILDAYNTGRTGIVT